MRTAGDGAGKPLWIEEAAQRWLARWSDRSALVVAAAAVLVVGVLDHLSAHWVGYDFEATALYIVPIAFSAWAAGTGASLLCALLATGVEGYVTWVDGPGQSLLVTVVSVTSELLVFMGAAYTFSRLRWHLDFERHISRTDPLTGIGNGRAFEEVAARELARLQRRAAPLSVAFFDLDDFKSVNDARGHAAGNDLLRAVGETLQSDVRGADFAARVGGDEFVLLFPDTDAATCRVAVERLRVRLREAVQAAGFSTTFSIGVVTFLDPPAASDVLLSASDRAMYRVKHGTKDGVHYEEIGAAGRPAVESSSLRPTGPS